MVRCLQREKDHVEAGQGGAPSLLQQLLDEAAAADLSPEERAAVQAATEQVFESGARLFKGYVEDRRNTDNAWVEAVVALYHDSDGSGLDSGSRAARPMPADSCLPASPRLTQARR
jgi:hypothetical protein